MSELALRDREVFPTLEILKRGLGDTFPAFEELMEWLEENGIGPEWRY